MPLPYDASRSLQNPKIQAGWFLTRGLISATEAKHGARVLCVGCARSFMGTGVANIGVQVLHDDDVAGVAPHGCDACPLGAPGAC